MLMEMQDKEKFAGQEKLTKVQLVFFKYKPSTSSGKELESFDVPQLVCLIWKLMTLARD